MCLIGETTGRLKWVQPSGGYLLATLQRDPHNCQCTTHLQLRAACCCAANALAAELLFCCCVTFTPQQEAATRRRCWRLVAATAPCER